MSEASRRCAWAVMASCLVHAAIARSAYHEERASERVPTEPLWMELQLEQREPEPARVEATPSLEPDTQPRRSPARTRSPRAASTTQQPLADPDPNAVTVSEPPRVEQRASTIDLSPLAAARSLDDTYVPLHDAGVARDDDVDLSPTAQANALARQVPGLRASKGADRSAEGVVVDVAEDTLYNALRPWKLLEKTMHHSVYRYTGGGFDAAILPDGRVRFRDKDGPALSIVGTQRRETGPGLLLAPTPTAGLNLGDPGALLQRMRGKDPFAAERRLFMERTRALREYLSGRAAERGVPAEESRGEEPQREPPADR